MRTKVVAAFRYAANDPSVGYEPGDVPGENDAPAIAAEDVQSLIDQGFLADQDGSAAPASTNTPA